MNVFKKYLSNHELDVQTMSSEEIIKAYYNSGSRQAKELSEVAMGLPTIKELKVLMLYMEKANLVEAFVKGEHMSDS